MLVISPTLSIPDSELAVHAVRSQGAGGQHVNKVSTAIHLQFDIVASSLPAPVKHALRQLRDHRISPEGLVTIKAQQHRTQERNRQEAYERLRDLIQRAAVPPKRRKPTKPTRRAQERRIEEKKARGRQRAFRRAME